MRAPGSNFSFTKKILCSAIRCSVICRMRYNSMYIPQFVSLSGLQQSHYGILQWHHLMKVCHSFLSSWCHHICFSVSCILPAKGTHMHLPLCFLPYLITASAANECWVRLFCYPQEAVQENMFKHLFSVWGIISQCCCFHLYLLPPLADIFKHTPLKVYLLLFFLLT